MLNQILRPTFDDSTNLDKDALIGLMAAISLVRNVANVELDKAILNSLASEHSGPSLEDIFSTNFSGSKSHQLFIT